MMSEHLRRELVTLESLSLHWTQLFLPIDPVLHCTVDYLAFGWLNGKRLICMHFLERPTALPFKLTHYYSTGIQMNTNEYCLLCLPSYFPCLALLSVICLSRDDDHCHCLTVCWSHRGHSGKPVLIPIAQQCWRYCAFGDTVQPTTCLSVCQSRDLCSSWGVLSLWLLSNPGGRHDFILCLLLDLLLTGRGVSHNPSKNRQKSNCLLFLSLLEMQQSLSRELARQKRNGHSIGRHALCSGQGNIHMHVISFSRQKVLTCQFCVPAGCVVL